MLNVLARKIRAYLDHVRKLHGTSMRTSEVSGANAQYCANNASMLLNQLLANLSSLTAKCSENLGKQAAFLPPIESSPALPSVI